MAQRRFHYDRVFEDYLRERRIPYVSVDEAKKSLLPPGAALRVKPGEGEARGLKSFDFVVYGEGTNLLIEVKGRKIARARTRPAGRDADAEGSNTRPSRELSTSVRGRLESWVTEDDVDSLITWERLFGSGFDAAFVFVYWCEEQPPDGLFQEVVTSRGRWYALRSIRVNEYRQVMKPRSSRWGTVDLPREAFEKLSHPFAPPIQGSDGGLDPGPECPALDPLAIRIGP